MAQKVQRTFLMSGSLCWGATGIAEVPGRAAGVWGRIHKDPPGVVWSGQCAVVVVEPAFWDGVNARSPAPWKSPCMRVDRTVDELALRGAGWLADTCATG